MKHIWCNVAHYHLGLSYTESEKLLYSKDRWNDFYNNPKYKKHQYSNQLLFQFVFQMMPNYIYSFEDEHSSKLQQWYKIYMNSFLTQKETTCALFSKIQKTYHVLLRFVERVQRKYAKVRVNCDLNMEEIQLRDGYSIAIFQNQSQYYFTIVDLMKIFNSALIYSEQMFPESYIPKNPYTNEPFTYKALLQIYFAIRRSDYKFPLLLEMFYSSGFSVKRFVRKYEYFIREEIIKNFIRNGSEDDMCEYIHEMLEHRDIEKKIKISPGFPKDVLVKVFKKFVFLYLIAEYSLRSSHQQWQYFHVLKISLYRFLRRNPLFGRRMSRRVKTVDETTGKISFHRVSSYETTYEETSIASLTSAKRIAFDTLLQNDDFE